MLDSKRPQTAMPKKSFGENNKKDLSNSSSSLNELSESSNSISSREKIDFLEGLSKGKQKAAFENLIKEEADRIDMINKQKKKLKNINLLEEDIEGLYDWKTLFNHSRPISSYTKISKKKKKLEENKTDEFKFPVVLVDLPENEFKHYLQTTEISVPKKEEKNKSEKNEKKGEKKEEKKMEKKIEKKKGKGNCIRPMSVYSKRDKDDIFYFSQTFSDYYKEDLNSFCEKMPILKAKIKQDPSRLKSSIKKAHKQTKIREEELKKILISDDLILNRQEVIIAGKGGNAMPLLKTIYQQIHSEQPIENHKDIKYYFNTMKPLGNQVFVDYTRNDRFKHINEIISLRDKGSKNKNKINNVEVDKNEIKGLHLSTYNKNDPDLMIFNKIKEEENESYINVDENNSENKKEMIIQKENKIIQKPNIITEETNLSTQNKTENSYLKNQANLKKRPMTGKLRELRSELKENNRPLTSNVYSNRLLTGSNVSTLNSDDDFIPQKIFPLRPPSANINVTFNKINQRIQKSKNSFSKENFDYEIQFNSNSQRNIINRPKTANFKKTHIKNKLNELNKGINTMTKWEIEKNKDGRNQFVSYYNFNEYIDSVFSDGRPHLKIHKEEKNYYYPLHCYNKIAGKYYSCSNNAHVKAKRAKKKEIIDNVEFDEGNNFDNNQKRRIYSAI